jgi:glutamate dehydrogenase (NADP+)
MTELYRHIGQDIDVPAGDIGVGGREIGYLFGQYKRIKDAYEGGVLTGKDISYGGSLARKEATGYGLMFFLREMLSHHNKSVSGKTITISGSGNVAIYACQKAVSMGGKVVAMSDSNGCIYDEKGIDLDCIKEIKEIKRGRIKEYIEYHPDAKYFEQKPGETAPIWKIKTDIALPCATQNEITLEDAKILVENGVIAVAEGANMPSTLEATEYFIKNNILFAPAKAANAGGVATSAIEMSQNSMRFYYTFEEVEKKLEQIMINIFKECKEASDNAGLEGNYVAGANIAAFNKLANAMIAQGIV